MINYIYEVSDVSDKIFGEYLATLRECKVVSPLV